MKSTFNRTPVSRFFSGALLEPIFYFEKWHIRKKCYKNKNKTKMKTQSKKVRPYFLEGVSEIFVETQSCSWGLTSYHGRKRLRFISPSGIKQRSLISAWDFQATGMTAPREKCPYSEFFWSKCGKVRTRKTPNTDTFHAQR